MQDFGTKADNSPPPGGQLSAAEFNNLATENENAVLRSGQTLNGATDTQLAQSMFLHGVKSQSFQDSGAANAYVATPVSGAGGVLLPSGYTSFSGSMITFKASNTNTSASTLNIGQTTGTLIGSKAIRTQTDTALLPGSIVSGRYVSLIYNPAFDSSNGAWELLTAPAVQTGQINKLVNAAGTINQRGYVSGTATGGANQYTVDRWKVNVLGQNLTWVANGAGVTFTAPAGGVAQIIPAGYIEGGSYIISWSGSATATVNGTPVANGGGIAIAANTQTTVIFSGGTFAFPQLEIGPVASPFEWRQHIELSICQQFYEVGSGFMASYNTAGGSMATFIGFKATKRAIPTMGTVGSGASNCGGVSSTAVATDGFGAFAFVTATGSAQTSFTWTASAEL